MKKMYAVLLGFLFVGASIAACGKEGCSHDQEKPKKEKPEKEAKE